MYLLFRNSDLELLKQSYCPFDVNCKVFFEPIEQSCDTLDTCLTFNECDCSCERYECSIFKAEICIEEFVDNEQECVDGLKCDDSNYILKRSKGDSKPVLYSVNCYSAKYVTDGSYPYVVSFDKGLSCVRSVCLKCCPMEI